MYKPKQKTRFNFVTDSKFALRPSSLGIRETPVIRQFESEPSNAELRRSEHISPERDTKLKPPFFTPKLLDSNGNLIKKYAEDVARKIVDEKEEKSGKKGAIRHKSKEKLEKEKKLMIKQEMLALQRRLLAMQLREDAARRAFLNKKMPSVGKLWIHQLLIDGMRKEEKARSKTTDQHEG